MPGINRFPIELRYMLVRAIDAAKEVDRAVLEVYKDFSAEHKNDHSALTLADKRRLQGCIE